MQSETHFDVVICGGGLAGLTLARQLKLREPELSVCVIERRRRPLPLACHKVGESSVEVGAHYFESVCELRPYLEKEHFFKNGLRFFSGDTQGPLELRTELGPSEQPKVPSFQLDRGKLENDLRAMNEAQGIQMLEGFAVQDIVLGHEPHQVKIQDVRTLETRSVSCRWVVDALGRRKLLQKKMNLTVDNGHKANAAWFRIQKKLDATMLVPASSELWHNRDVGKRRWLSTQHLMGKGYWVWFIPLSSGYTSVGIVVGDEHHPWDTLNTKAKSLEWLERHEPLVYQLLKDEAWSDFLFFRDYSYGSKQVYSSERWSCVGEAGLFVDPLYSPGSDLIALSNCFTTELILRDRKGEDVRERSMDCNNFMLQFAEITTALFRNNTHVNGVPRALASKLYWDYFQYWSFICPYFFGKVYRDDSVETHKTFTVLGAEWLKLNAIAQKILGTWAAMAEPNRTVHPPKDEAVFLGLPRFPSVLADMHLALLNPKSVDETKQVIEDRLEQAKVVVHEIAKRAIADLGIQCSEEFYHRAALSLAGFKLEDLISEEETTPTDLVKNRRKQLPVIARDMERLLGRIKPPPAHGAAHEPANII